MEIEKYYTPAQITTFVNNVKNAKAAAAAAIPPVVEPTNAQVRAFVSEVIATNNIERVISDAGGIAAIAVKHNVSKAYAKILVQEINQLISNA